MYHHVVGRGGAASGGGGGSIVMIGSMYGVVGSYPDAYEGVSVASPVQYHALKGGINDWKTQRYPIAAGPK